VQPQALATAGRHSSSRSRHPEQLLPPLLLLLLGRVPRRALAQLCPHPLLLRAASLCPCPQTQTQRTAAATAPQCAPQMPPQTHRTTSRLALPPTALPLAP
jgi:hypothetical protein